MTETSSGFDAFGHKVPAHRLAAAYDAVKEMAPEATTEQVMTLVGRVANHVERDKPYEALRQATNAPLPLHVSSAQKRTTPEPGLFLDLTGGYRLLATLCEG